MQKFGVEASLIIENLAREMTKAVRWSAIWDIHNAMLRVRRMADNRDAEREHPSDLGQCEEKKL